MKLPRKLRGLGSSILIRGLGGPILIGMVAGSMMATSGRVAHNRTFNQQCVTAYQATPALRNAPGSATFSGHQRFPDSDQVASAVMTITRKANPQRVKSQRLTCHVTPEGTTVRPQEPPISPGAL